MTLKVSAPDGVQVYSVSGGKNLPDWANERKHRRKLKKDEEYRTRIQLLQDFEFPSACQRIKASSDQQHLFATGYHPPQMRCYTLTNLSMKFVRHMEAEVVDFQVLSEDFSKLVFLTDNRCLEFHARFGFYHRSRVPRHGYDLTYAPFLAHLLVVGDAPEVYRLDLCEGRFYTPLKATSPALNACGWCPAHGLFGCAGSEGLLECFDLRQRKCVGTLDAASAAGLTDVELTALQFDDTGLQVAVGTSTGVVTLFDLRSPRPLQVKDHMYGSKIVDIKFHSATGGVDAHHSRRIVSSDRHIVKIWEADTGKMYTSIQPEKSGINDVCIWKDTGLFMVGCDQPKVEAFFIPSLGPAPHWCSFLEGLTEELEESQSVPLYDDYRFVTQQELDAVGLQHLVGTPMLKAYMHGFFIDNRLYSKAVSIAQPFAYEKFRQDRIKKKIEQERQSRISVIKKLPKINAKEALRILSRQKEGQRQEVDQGTDGNPRAKKKNFIANPLCDPRFKAMFEDEDFIVDTRSKEYMELHPNEAKLSRPMEEELLEEHFKEIPDEDAPEGDCHEQIEDELSDEELSKSKEKMKNSEQNPTREPRMLAAKTDRSADAFWKGETFAHLERVPLEQRLESGEGELKQRDRISGSKELTFYEETPRKERKQSSTKKKRKLKR